MDQRSSNYLTSLDNPLLKKALGVLTHLGTGAFWVTVYGLSLIFFHKDFTRLIFTLIVGEIIGLLTIIILRHITKRKRPVAKYNPFFLAPWNRYSFPSHHALRSFLIAVIIGAHHPGLLPFLMFMAATIGFTRLYLSKHYLSDVLVGALIGIVLGTELPQLVHLCP
jgi:undecaprenyl-diphosphatase